MAQKTSILVIGLDPFSLQLPDPHYGGGHWDATAIWAAIESELQQLNSLGLDAESCLTDRSAGASEKVTKYLKSKAYDCVVIGAGVRLPEENFSLFESIINAVHQWAPNARIAFNTRPDDTEAAVRRWTP